MAQKRSTTKRKTSRKKATAKKKGTSLGKLSLALLVIVVLGYASLAIWEGKLDTSFLDNDDDSKTTEESAAEPKTDNPSRVDAVQPDLESYNLYFTKAFDFCWPAYSAEQAVIERPYYTLRYSEEHEQATWVAYQLYADSLRLDKFTRKNDFREDTRVRTESAALADYSGSGYDRGHLAPAADFSYSEFALSQSFYMSNMSPQDPSFNRGIWKKLEDQVRDWTMEFDHLYVVTGPVLNKRFETIGSNKVSIPEQYYKIVLDIDKPGIKAIAFLMKNEKSSEPLSSFVVTIDEIEKITGLDFFPSISDELEGILESSTLTSDWF